MELNEVIKKRRSCRAYYPEDISEDIIKELIENARLAPSAANRQPWYFVVLMKEKKDEISAIMAEEIKHASAIRDQVKKATKKYNPTSSVKESIKVIEESPVLILVFKEKNPIWLEGDYLSIGCAVEHICLTATNLNFGSLWVRDVVYTKTKIASFLGLENMELVTGVVIGKPKEENYRAKKKDLNSILTIYK